MTLRSYRAFFALVAALVLAVACGSSNEDAGVIRAKLAESCFLDSDCASPYRCAFQKCHTQCEESRDCEALGTDARCIIANRPFNVCQLPDEKGCSYNSDCPNGQRCASDRECRDECKSDIDCVKGQVCTTGVCAEPKELVNGSLPPPADGGTPLTNNGQACSLNSDCVQPLRCRLGVCAVECKQDVDCENKPNNRCNAVGVCEYVAPNGSTCVPADCKSAGKTCGTITDGCGGTLNCGKTDGTPDCGVSETCGGGGANKCGTSTCVPKSCQQLGDDCGLVDDECSGVLNCGACATGSTCGGAGVKNKCGCVADNVTACAGKNCGAVTNNCGQSVDCGTCAAGTTCGATAANQCGCKKKSCAELGLQCGTAPDGCGGTAVCGNCPAGQACGGGGSPNQCGGNACVPTSCAALGKNCGTISNGCDASLTCGSCSGSETCGGAGDANVCGCTKKSCDLLGKNCGSVGDGCGGTQTCGSCVSPSTCGGGGMTNVCGCAKTTCALQGKDCGTIPDGCGGTLTCGSCAGGKLCGASGVNNVCTTPGAVKSCNGVAKTCGPSGNDDCCRNELVPGTNVGEAFYRRYSSLPPPGAQPAVPQYPAKVSSYRLDVYEVTNGRFRTFLNAASPWAYKTTPPPVGSGAHSNVTTTYPISDSVGTGWQAAWNTNLPADFAAYSTNLQNCSNTWTTGPAGSEDRPVECVDWYEAAAFCAWDGGRLPTWSEWEYAFTGGTEYRRYPWGSDIPTCDHDEGGACPWPLRVGTQSLGAGKWGQYNLSGGVAEFVFDTTYYPPQSPDCSGADCAYYSASSSYAVVMGGRHYENLQYTPNQWGEWYGPFSAFGQRNQRAAGIGFRCARNL